MDAARLGKDGRTKAAVERSLTIIGEAAQHIPERLELRAREVDWVKVRGLRDLLAYGCAPLDAESLWTIVTGSVPMIERSAQSLLDSGVE